MSRVTCPKCGYSWIPRSKSKFLTCPRCYSKVRNPLFSPTSTTTRSSGGGSGGTGTGGGTQLRELLVVLSNGRKVRLLCNGDLSACDIVEPGDLGDGELVEALGKVYDQGLSVLEKSSNGIEVMVLG